MKKLVPILTFLLFGFVSWSLAQPTNLPVPMAKSVMSNTNGLLLAHPMFLKTNIVAGTGIAIVTNGAPNANGIAIHAMISGTGMTNVTIYSSNASSANVIVHGFTGGTNDLQQWQDSNGVPVAQVASNGVFYGDGSGLSNVIAAAVPSPYLTNATAYSSNTTDVPLQAYPRTGTGTNAFQTTTTNGTPAFRVDADGDLAITGLILTDDTNVNIGRYNFDGNLTGMYNVGLGNSNFCQLIGGSDNFGVGNCNFYNVRSNSLNYGIGYRNFYVLTNGTMNIAIGYRNFYGLDSGNYNTGLGQQNAYILKSGTGNIAIGKNNLMKLTNGNNNLVFGEGNFYWMQSGSANVGFPVGAGTNLVSGNNNIFLGADTWVANGDGVVNNAVVFGHGASVATNDVIILGSTNRVGINTNNPQATLHVFGNILVDSNIQASSVSGDITNQLTIVMTNYVNDVSNKVYSAATNDAYALAGAAATNYTDAVSNNLFATTTQTATNLGTNYLPLSGGTVYGAVLSTSSTATNGPAANEFVSAQWVRGILSGGEMLYNITNRHPVNDTYYQASQFTNDQPQVRLYTNTGAGNYMGTGIMSTQRYTTVYSPMSVDVYLSMSGPAASTTLHPEFYYSYDGTNLLGDYSCGTQSIVSGSTNLYQFIISFPTIESTNSTGFYVVRRIKVDAQSGASTVVGIHGSGGTPSHIGFQYPPEYDVSLGIRGALAIDYSGCPSITNAPYDTNTRTFILEGPSVPMAVPGSNVIYVSLSGDDATAVVGNPYLPFLTISNALLQVTNNMLVSIGPGVFNVSSKATNGLSSSWPNDYPLRLHGMTNVTIRGSGRNSTKIEATNGGGVFIIRQCQDLLFEDFWVAGPTNLTGGSATHALINQIPTNLNLTFRDMYIGPSEDHGFCGNVSTVYCTNVTFENCYFYRCGRNGPNGSDGTAIANPGSDLKVIGCYFENNYRCIEWEGESTNYSHAIITGNTFRNSRDSSIWISITAGWESAYTDFIISGNHFFETDTNIPDGVIKACIVLNGGRRITIADNHFDSISRHPIYVVPSSLVDQLAIRGNIILGSIGNGITVETQNKSLPTPENIIIENNVISRTQSDAIQVIATNVVIRNNMIYDYGTNGINGAIKLRAWPDYGTNRAVLVEGNRIYRSSQGLPGWCAYGIIVSNVCTDIVLKDNWIQGITTPYVTDSSTNVIMAGERTNQTERCWAQTDLLVQPRDVYGRTGLVVDDYTFGSFGYAGLGFDQQLRTGNDYNMLYSGNEGYLSLSGRNRVYLRINGNANNPVAVAEKVTFRPFADRTSFLGTNNYTWTQIHGETIYGTNIYVHGALAGAGTNNIATTNWVVPFAATCSADVQLLIASAKLGTNNTPALDGGENSWRLLYDDTGNETNLWQFMIPNDYSSGGTLRLVYTMASATADTAIMGCQVMCVSPGDEADINTDSYDTASLATNTVPGTAGYLQGMAISPALDSMAGGDLVKIKLYRDAVNDTASGDLELVGAVWEYRRTR